MAEDIERPKLLVEDSTELEAHLADIEEAATDVLVAVWKAIQSGKLDERSVIADATLRMRDALNPNWPADPDWLPEELRD
jgi:hypothetical protein